MRILCKLSDVELLRLQGQQSSRVWLRGKHFIQWSILEEESYAILYEKQHLKLVQQGEHSWRGQIPSRLTDVFTHPNRELFIEEHPYHGPARAYSGRMVTKLVRRIGGAPLVPVTEAEGKTAKYIAPALATISRYYGGQITLKELRLTQLDIAHWQLIIWVWRGHAREVPNHQRLAVYRNVILEAKNFAFENKKEREIVG